MTTIITRIAPSPTGNAHIGLVRTAYLNWLAARANGGRFILRIDDTDKVRSKPEFEENIVDTFKWLGLDWDRFERQSARTARYAQVAEDLLVKGLAEVREGAVYLKPKRYLPDWQDSIAGTVASGDRNAVENLVLLRADKSATYHFASCVDDVDMGVNWIIRGTDHIPNTGKHIHIYDALDAPLPKFTHVGLIFHQKKKISKRDATGVAWMANYQHRHPHAVLNAVLRLGWSHPDSKLEQKYPTINPETALRLFNEGALRAAPSNLDLAKLEWLDKQFKK